jgi:aminoglycoside 6-adenylyltransferase
MLTLQDIEKTFTAWALQEKPVRAAIVIGSQARIDHPADRWSDLDIILFTTETEAYLNSTAWFEAFAPVWTSIQGRTAAGESEHLVLYAGGLQVDFVLDNAAVLSDLSQMAASGQFSEAVHRGVRILFDKDHLIPPLPTPGTPPAHLPPSQAEFTHAWTNFWFSAIHAAKQLRRGDLAFYKGAEQRLRNLILPFLEWHTRLSRGWGTDTWHQGRFLAEWLEPGLYSQIAQTFTSLEPAASWQGLQHLLDLAQPIIQETARELKFSYPMETEKAMRSYVDILASGSK